MEPVWPGLYRLPLQQPTDASQTSNPAHSAPATRFGTFSALSDRALAAALHLNEAATYHGSMVRLRSHGSQ